MNRNRTTLFAIFLISVLAPACQRTHDWSWLNGTYWYVAQQDLPAIATDPKSPQPQPVLDQTVWVIEGYSHGYLWGKTFVQLTGQSRLCLTMVGSVTPEGSVVLTFSLPVDNLPDGLTLKTTGIGRMNLVRGEWRVEMQMTTGLTTLVTHWANMKQCKEGEACNRRLPGTQSSLQDFIAACATP